MKQFAFRVWFFKNVKWVIHFFADVTYCDL